MGLMHLMDRMAITGRIIIRIPTMAAITGQSFLSASDSTAGTVGLMAAVGLTAVTGATTAIIDVAGIDPNPPLEKLCSLVP